MQEVQEDEARESDASGTRDARQKEEGKGREEEGNILSAFADERDVESIFQAYPSKRRGGRKEAHKAIRTALKDVRADVLLSRVQTYACSQDVLERAAKGEWNFLPLLSTWMNKGRYDAGDELPVGEMVQLTANDI